MTTIAWDGRNLAGDKQRSLDGHITRCRKVFKITCKHNGKQALIGCAGDTADIIRARDWFVDCSKPKPTCKNMSGLLVVKMKTGAKCFWFEESLTLVPLERRPFAVGSGGPHALGAMDAGADAKRAVQIASNRDSGTGRGVDVIAL